MGRGKKRSASSRRRDAEVSEGPPFSSASRWRTARVGIAVVILLAFAQYAWNAQTMYPLHGYDAPGHAGYVLTILEEGRLPHPHEGWSTFHPPLYYLIGAFLWKILEPSGPHAVELGLIGIGAVSWLLAGWVAFTVVRKLQGDPLVACTAAALVLFVPCAQIAATSIGNEALTAGLSALAVLFLLRLQIDPRDMRAAVLTGLLVGLTLATKFTGLFVAGACIVPFLRRDFDQRMARSLAMLATVVALLSGPVYLRNIALTGTPVPMTRDREPVRTVEGYFILRDREVRDYLTFDLNVLRRPSIFQLPGQPPSIYSRNPSMANVWGLLYASTWYDPFGNRILLPNHRDEVLTGPLLTFLGLVPTVLMLIGFSAAVKDALLRRGRSPDAPLVIMALIGVGLLVAFTWRAPSMVAVKASYLLPVIIPAAVFFARGTLLFGRRGRIPLVALSALAALAAALVFTNGLVFQSAPMSSIEIEAWRGFAQTLGSEEMTKAMTFLLGSR